MEYRYSTNKGLMIRRRIGLRYMDFVLDSVNLALNLAVNEG
jgi:hypothetical protein